MYIMHRRSLLPVILLLMFQLKLAGQESAYGPGYQSAMTGNPGITGSEGDGMLRLSYVNLYPGNAYNLHAATVSYDGYFPSLHGGAGFYVSNNYLGGIINDLKSGVSYSYFFRAGKDLWFSAGLSASLWHRAYSMGGVVLPDQIDPLRGSVLPSGESLAPEGRTIFDLGTGFVFYSGKLHGGAAVNHLAEPDLSLNDLEEGKLRRRLFIHLAADLGNGSSGKLTLQPLGIFEMQKGRLSGGAGTALTMSHISVSSLVLCDNGSNFDIQAGLRVAAGIVDLFYNYRFNIFSGEDLLPFTLQHHTGVALRLYNVDKRKTIKTIKFPIL